MMTGNKTKKKHGGKQACSRVVRKQVRRAEMTVAERRVRRSHLRKVMGVR